MLLNHLVAASPAMTKYLAKNLHKARARRSAAAARRVLRSSRPPKRVSRLYFLALVAAALKCYSSSNINITPLPQYNITALNKQAFRCNRGGSHGSRGLSVALAAEVQDLADILR